MNVHLVLAIGTLPTEHQAVVEALNQFLAWLPDDDDPNVALRLAMEILEAAGVAPQAVLAQVAGLAQTRSVREYKQRLRPACRQAGREQGLAGLFDRPGTGRPAVTTQTAVEQAVIQGIVRAVIQDHTLPDDRLLAERVNRSLGEAEAPEAWAVTASMVETIRLRWGIQRLLFPSTLAEPPAEAPAYLPAGRPARLGRPPACRQAGGWGERSSWPSCC